VILSDDVVVGDRPCIGQLIHAYNQTHSSIVAVMEVPDDETHRYGVIAGEEVEGTLNHGRLHKVSRLVEKPARGEAPSNLAIIGRYVLTPKIFDKLEQTQSEGIRYDAGTTMGWLKASVELALERPDLAPEFRQYLKTLEI
jgi:UTP--glucose-1-phosphate uridylyltransferase